METASKTLVFVFSWFFLFGGAAATIGQDDEKFTKAALIEFDGPIFNRSYQYFKRKLNAAKSYGADLLIIEIDSPGGALEESLLIAEALRDVDWARTIAFIPEKALSGAALASLGCDEIVISEKARIGDAGIIFRDKGFAFQYAPEKIITDLVRRARDLAEFKGRPPELAEAMIDMDSIVFQNRNNPKQFEIRRAVNSGYPHRQGAANVEERVAIKQKLDEKEWELVEEAGENRFLEVNGKRALQLGIAQKNADSRTDLEELFGLTGGIKIYRETTTDVVIYWLNLPVITGLLFVIGLIAIYLEFTAPGIGVGALIGGLCFAIFFWSHFLGGTAGILEVLLFLAGIVFVAMEIFVIPGFGVAGVAGIFLLFISILMASQDFVIPQTAFEMEELKQNLYVILGSGAAFLVGAFFLSKYLGRVPIVSSLMLTPPSDKHDEVDSDGKKKGAVGVHPVVSVGDWGVAESVLRPAGKVKFGDQTVDVIADGSFIQPNEQVKVIEISGNRVLVVKA